MKNKVYLWVVAAAFLAACSSSNGRTYQVDTQWSAGASNVGFYAADQAVDAGTFRHVFVTVTEIHLNASNTEGDEGSGWQISKVATPTAIDLLKLTDGATKLLTDAKVNAGTYQQIRLILAKNLTSAPFVNYVILAADTESKTPIALTTPSGQKTGLKINNLSVKVDDTNKTVIVLDFLVSKSIHQTGSDEYMLKPVINADVGTVTSASASANATVSTTTQGTSNL